MKNYQNKKINAFTLAETLIVMSVIGIVVVLTSVSTINSSKMKEKKFSTISKTFYSNIAGSYNDVLMNGTNSYSLEYLRNNSDNREENSAFILELFARYANGDMLANCNSFPTKSTLSVDACAEFNNGIIAGLFYDKNCNTKVDVLEYSEIGGEAKNTRTIQNSCGYIVYAIKDNDTILGRNLFTIGLGKRSVR